MVEVLGLVADLLKKGINLYSIKGGYAFDGSIQSKIITTVLAMASEIERDLISQRTIEALKLRKSQGVQLGRPPGPGKSKLDDKLNEIKNLSEKKISVASMAKIFDCSWVTMKHFLDSRIKS